MTTKRFNIFGQTMLSAPMSVWAGAGLIFAMIGTFSLQIENYLIFQWIQHGYLLQLLLALCQISILLSIALSVFVLVRHYRTGRHLSTYMRSLVLLACALCAWGIILRWVINRERHERNFQAWATYIDTEKGMKHIQRLLRAYFRKKGEYPETLIPYLTPARSLEHSLSDLPHDPYGSKVADRYVHLDIQPGMWLITDSTFSSGNRFFDLKGNEVPLKIDDLKLLSTPYDNLSYFSYSSDGKHYSIRSNGPDGIQDCDLQLFFIRSIANQSPEVNTIYDPTNGLVSTGDIVIFQ